MRHLKTRNSYNKSFQSRGLATLNLDVLFSQAKLGQLTDQSYFPQNNAQTVGLRSLSPLCSWSTPGLYPTSSWARRTVAAGGSNYNGELILHCLTLSQAERLALLDWQPLLTACWPECERARSPHWNPLLCIGTVFTVAGGMIRYKAG